MSLTNQLSLFLDVVQQGSFVKAAALHNMDNSSLSKQIKKLENHLGVRLLNRSTRSFSLTPAGEEILKQTHTLVETLDNIHHIADTYQSQPKGSLRIASSIYFGQTYLQPVICDFMKRYPDVHITLSLDDKKSDIIGDHIDLAFRIGRLSDSNLVAKKLANINLAIVAATSFIEQHGMPTHPEALLALPAAIYSNGESTLDTLRISEQPHSTVMRTFKMNGNYRSSDVKSQVNVVKAGLGYALIDLFNLDDSLAALDLVPLLTNYRLSSFDKGIYAIYPHRKHTLLVAEFIKSVQESIGSPPFWLDYLPGYDQLYQ